MRKLLTSFLIVLFLFFLVLPVEAGITPNDPYYSRQWYLPRIEADSAWTKVKETPDITVAVIDSGVDINNPDLKNNIWINPKEIAGNGLDDDHNGFIDDVNGWDFVNNVPDPSPKFDDGWTEAGISHGTMVAGIIGAEGNNGIGVTGVTWKAKIMPLRVLNDKGEGKISAVVRAIDYAVANGADVINLSFVTYNYSEALYGAIYRAYRAGVVVVAAAGNDQLNVEGRNTSKSPIYPACMDGPNGENMVIGVAATDALDQKTPFSSYGFSCIDITAPGISFFNTITYGGNAQAQDPNYDGYWSGTSMAAPVVSGVVALVAQVNPDLSRSEIINLILGSANNISLLNPDYLGQLGHGRVNANGAVNLARDKMYDHITRLLVAPSSGSNKIKITSVSGATVSEFSVPDFKTGFNVASGDVNGDGESEIILAAEKGSQPWVRIYDKKGKLLKQFLAYDKNFKGGVRLAVGDFSNHGVADIIVAPGPGGGPHVRVWSGDGKLLRQFFADDAKTRGGLTVAIGDLDNNGQNELVIGAGVGRQPFVKIYSNQLKLQGSFLAFPKDYLGGVNLAVASMYGRLDHHKQSIVVAPAGKYRPLVKVYNNSGVLKKQFLAYGENWQGGINIAAGDISNDGKAEIITGAKSGATPHVRVFDGEGGLIDSFYAYEDTFSGGVSVGLLKFNN
ncbi:MAG: S8 family peptidase [Candidatus Falkowbacteria bacterium]